MVKYFSLSIFLTFPLKLYAHGEDVLADLTIETVLFIVIVVFLFVYPLQLKRKVMLFLGYFITLLSVIFLTKDVPYNEHRIFLLTLGIGLPLTVFLILLFLSKKH